MFVSSKVVKNDLSKVKSKVSTLIKKAPIPPSKIVKKKAIISKPSIPTLTSNEKDIQQIKNIKEDEKILPIINRRTTLLPSELENLIPKKIQNDLFNTDVKLEDIKAIQELTPDPKPLHVDPFEKVVKISSRQSSPAQKSIQLSYISQASVFSSDREQKHDNNDSLDTSPQVDYLINHIPEDKPFLMNIEEEVGAKLTKRSLENMLKKGQYLKSINEIWFENSNEYIISLNCKTPIEVTPPTSFTSSDYTYDMCKNGRMQYIGMEQICTSKCSVSMSIRLTKEQSQNINTIIVIEIRKNGNVIAGSNYRQCITNEYQTISFHKMIKLSCYDCVSVFVTNLTSNRGISVYSFNLMIE
jgi:hypothetical protein